MIGNENMSHAPEFLKIVDQAKKIVRELTVADVAEKMKRGEKFLLVDVREDDEWKAGYAKDAMHLGKGIIERDIETDIPNKDSEIVLYCGGGFRSALAGEQIQRMGYTNVYSMDGGIKGWRAAQLPEEKPE